MWFSRRPAVLVSALFVALLAPSTQAAPAGLPCGIFVSTNTGSDTPTCGLDAATPCQTINQGIARAVAESQTCMFLQAGVYSEIPDFSGVQLTVQGGYDANWNFSTHSDPSHRATITGGFASMYVGVTVRNASSVTLNNLEVVSPPASGFQASLDGHSSYGIHVVGSTLTLDDVKVTVGNGADGAAGNAGSASPAPAPSGNTGGAAQEFATPCDNTSRGAGGTGAVNPSIGSSSRGGSGGAGGTMDTDCGFPGDFSATAGFSGQNANVFAVNSYGYRGAAGVPCAAGTPGNDGRVINGAGGPGAPAGGAFIANLWNGTDGSSGQLGEHGGGGGGGGGSGGCDTGTDSYGAGGGGGGSGGERAPVSGTGGKAGGGSFGVFAENATLFIANSQFVRGNGGRGGRGGAGGAGQSGGFGGAGGPGEGDSGPGGDGGDGGDGGHSGGGGGGAGGPAFGIYTCNTTVNQVGNTFGSGSPGGGGAGGSAASGGNAGLTGASGVLGSIGSGCTSPQLAASAVVVPASLTVGGPICDPAPCLTVSVPGAPASLLLEFAGAAPNPASGGTSFRFSLPRDAHVKLRVYDANGRLVRRLDTAVLGAGAHTVAWDGRNATGARADAGIYFAEFQALDRKFVRRFSLVR